MTHISNSSLGAIEAALILIELAYSDGILDPWISRSEVDAFAYFLQEAGENLGLKYRKGEFGPYSPNLKKVSGDIDRNDVNIKEKALQVLAEHPHTYARAKRVIELLDGMHSEWSLELLLRAHWQIRHEKKTIEEVFSVHHKADEQKRLGLVIGQLVNQGWITPSQTREKAIDELAQQAQDQGLYDDD